jgi:hypothetical protein
LYKNHKPAQLKTVLLFLLLSTFTPLFAQNLVSGYQGRRWYAEANMSATPTIVGPSYDNYGSQRFSSDLPNVYDLSARIGADMHYVAGRHLCVFGGYEYARTGMLMQAVSPSLLLPDGVTTTDNDVHHLFYQMRLHTVQAGAEFYTNPSLLAPLGVYFRVALQYNILLADLRERQTTFSNAYGGTRFRNLYLNKMETYEITPVVEIGSRTVLANRLTLSIGARTQLPIMALSTLQFSDANNYLPSFGNDDTYIMHNFDAFHYAARQRMLWHGIFMIRVGVGFLF